MTPYIFTMAAFLIAMVAAPFLIRWIGPWTRQFPRIVRLVILVPVVLVPVVALWYALRRKGLGLRETGCLAAVMLVEDLPFQAASRRSAELVRKAGSLRAAVQRWYFVSMIVLSLLFGAFLGAKGAASARPEVLLVWTPVVAAGFVVFLTINSVFGSLMYLSARRATGESMEAILQNLERSSVD